ncbi:MAG: hypothetical protein CL556_10615 [Alphaproteobacteria bacterium]|nr:hypothetical protein [Alphaproteobacteria bacterium]
MIAGSLIIFQLYLMSFKQSKINFIVFFLFLIICFLNNSLTLYLSLILNSLFFLIFFQKKINIKFNIYLIIFIIICSFGIINKKAQIDKIQSIFDPVARYIQNKSYTFSSKYNILIKEALIDKANKLEQDEISKNLSSDVWIKSAKITFYSFKNYPLGVGINNFIFSHNNYIDNISVNFDITRDLNKEDASFVLAKIISEFGLFSFLIFFIIFKFIFSKKIGFQFKLFLLPNIFTQLFIRGAGYFNGGFIIFILIILFLLINKKEEND